MKGIYITGISVIVVLALLLVPYGTAWSSGQTAGYKWITDWKTAFSKEYKTDNVSFDGVLSGKSALAYFIKFIGTNKGMSMFHFEGVFYSYGMIKGTIQSKSNIDNSKDKINVDLEDRNVWFVYNGDFSLVKVNKPEVSYYGIKSLTFHVFTKKPLDISSNMTIHHTNANDSGVGSFGLYVVGSLDITSKVDFQKPLPYIIINGSTSMLSEDYIATYSGHASEDITGKAHLSAQGSGFSYGKMIASFDFSHHFKNKPYGGKVDIGSPFFFGEGHPGIFVAIPIMAFDAIPGSNVVPGLLGNSQSNISATMKNYMELVLGHTVKGELDKKTMLYSKEYLSFTGTGSSGYLAPVGGYGNSTAVSESEVREMESNAPAMYGAYTSQALWLLLSVGVVVAVAIAVIIYAFWRIKKE